MRAHWRGHRRRGDVAREEQLRRGEHGQRDRVRSKRKTEKASKCLWLDDEGGKKEEKKDV